MFSDNLINYFNVLDSNVNTYILLLLICYFIETKFKKSSL